MNIEIDNIKDHHRKALIDLLGLMQQLGNIGGSGNITFYSDGDGDFRPRIKVDGEEIRLSMDLWNGKEYYIDTDMYYEEIDQS